MPQPRRPINSQRIGSKDVAGIQQKLSAPSIEAAKDFPPSSSLEISVAEEIQRLESGKLTGEFSNLGGRLRSVLIKGYNASFPTSAIIGLQGYDQTAFSVEEKGWDSIVYVYEDSEVKISRSYRLSADDYAIEASTRILNKSDMSKMKDIIIDGAAFDMSKLNKKDNGAYYAHMQDKGLLEYVVSAQGGVHRKNNASRFSSKEDRQNAGRVDWIGFRSRYFCAIVKPQYPSAGYSIKTAGDEKISLNFEERGVNISSKEEKVFNHFIYVGPEKSELLVKYGFGLENIKRYYRFELFDGIAKIIYSIIYNINKVIPNWGLCIIIISLIVYFSMYPLTLKSMASMRKMQYLQPKIAAIREKYKDNPRKMNEETMELYKKEKINPFGGCLPMLLQMPVFIGLYQVLWRSVSLKGAKFLWINDLSEPDRLFIIPFHFPVIENEINFLPVVMTIVMGIQQKLTSRNMVVSDPAQAAQQKMMSVIMPVFMGVIFYRFASGLTLYFTMFYALSTWTQWKMSKAPKAE